MRPKVKVLVVDDSAIVRTWLNKKLGADPEIEIVGLAPDPFVARDILLKKDPDVVLLDMEMPRMDGLTFLRKIMKYKPTPTIVVSSVTPKGCSTALACLEAGAVEVLCKPGSSFSIESLIGELLPLVKQVGRQKGAILSRAKSRIAPIAEGEATIATTHKVVAIGSSTGGPEAVREVLSALPRNTPGIVMVLRWILRVCMRVRLARGA